MPDTKPRCFNPNCHGHISKFSTCIAEALYSSDADETTGTVEYQGHLSVFHVAEPYTYVDLDGTLAVNIPVGTYHLLEDDQGFVTLETYDLYSTEADKAFTEFDESYAEWDEE